MIIRRCHPGEELTLRAVFYLSVHGIARRNYSPAQLDAWAPQIFDADQWITRIRRNNPFVAEVGGRTVGFADLQDDGLIDHFFVEANYCGMGVGSALMNHLHLNARERGIDNLRAEVSLTAQPFFERYGFVVVRRQQVEVRGVRLDNAVMVKALQQRLKA
jgi:putative acetyltransferase